MSVQLVNGYTIIGESREHRMHTQADIIYGSSRIYLLKCAYLVD
jgi:hypothetical protein